MGGGDREAPAKTPSVMPSTLASNGMTPPRGGGQNKVNSFSLAALDSSLSEGAKIKSGAPPLFRAPKKDFALAKDLWEKEERALEPCPDERGAAKFALLRCGRQGKGGITAITPSVLLPTFVGQQDSSLERALKIRYYKYFEARVWAMRRPSAAAEVIPPA